MAVTCHIPIRRHRTRNGVGKTTLLRMMATVIPPDSGHVRLLGHDPGGYGPLITVHGPRESGREPS
jgi:ABC-type glutathione transport system ATPase component